MGGSHVFHDGDLHIALAYELRIAHDGHDTLGVVDSPIGEGVADQFVLVDGDILITIKQIMCDQLTMHGRLVVVP